MQKAQMAVESAPAFVALEGLPHHVLNESAFRYFFELERARAAQAMRPLLLLVVRVPRHERAPGGARSRVVAKIFAALAGCVRDADFVGWYRDGTIAGAVLTVTGPVSNTMRHAVYTRVVRTLLQSLTPEEFARVSAHIVVVGRTGSL